jgi:hypothetical protein
MVVIMMSMTRKGRRRMCNRFVPEVQNCFRPVEAPGKGIVGASRFLLIVEVPECCTATGMPHRPSGKSSANEIKRSAALTQWLALDGDARLVDLVGLVPAHPWYGRKATGDEFDVVLTAALDLSRVHYRALPRYLEVPYLTRAITSPFSSKFGLAFCPKCSRAALPTPHTPTARLVSPSQQEPCGAGHQSRTYLSYSLAASTSLSKRPRNLCFFPMLITARYLPVRG